jgi:hypothetical protein
MHTQRNAAEGKQHPDPSICITISSAATHIVLRPSHTSTDDFLLNPPISQDGEQKSESIDNRHSQTQLYKAQLVRIKLSREEQHHIPACPMSRKNHTLPVRLISNGTAYRGLLSRSTRPKYAPTSLLFSQLACTSAR